MLAMMDELPQATGHDDVVENNAPIVEADDNDYGDGDVDMGDGGGDDD